MRSVWLKARVIAISIFLPIFSCSMRAQQPQTQKQEIYQLLSAHNYQQAEKAATTYLSSSPQDCGVRTMLGLALRGETKLEASYSTFHSAMEQCPQSLPAIEGAAETAFLLNKPEAKDLVTKVIQLRPGEETGYAMLGAIDARSADCEGTVENYAKAPSRVATSIPALRQYGSCLMALSRPADAVAPLARLLALQESDASRIALAHAQADAKDRAAALATLQPLLGTDSRDSSAFLLAAQITEAGNDTPKAVEWFRKAIEVNPKNATAYLAFSEMSFNHAAFKVGLDFLNLGIQQLPSEARLYLARGVLEGQLARTDAALRDFQEAHRLDPHLSFAEDAMGMLFSQKHDNAAALELFARQAQIHPNDPLLQYLYAEALSQVQNPDQKTTEKAIAAAQHAVQLEPGYQPARDLLCVLLLRHNDLADVIAQAEEAIKRDPYDEVALYQELLAEHKLNHADRGAIVLKEFQAAKAHNQEAQTKYVLKEESPPQ